jgi:hypothetical protein
MLVLSIVVSSALRSTTFALRKKTNDGQKGPNSASPRAARVIPHPESDSVIKGKEKRKWKQEGKVGIYILSLKLCGGRARRMNNGRYSCLQEVLCNCNLTFCCYFDVV